MGFMPGELTTSVNSGSFINLISMVLYFYFRQLIQLLYEAEITVNPFNIPAETFQLLRTLLFIMALFNDLLVIFSSCFSQLT